MPVTMREIAEAAQVSISTVSRVLNGHPAISEDRARQILAVADRLKYQRRSVPAGGAAMNGLRQRAIGIVSLGMAPRLLALPTVARTINAAAETLSESGARVELRHIPEVDDSLDELPTEVDALILIGALQGEAAAGLPKSLLERVNSVPHVWLLGRPGGCNGDVVAPNAFATGCRAAEYLVERGHVELAFLSPKPDHRQFMAREDGFLSQARRLGVRVQSFCEDPPGGWPLPLQPPTDVATVQKLVDAVLEAQPRPTAIFTAADSVAALVYRALAQRSVEIGRDISVISANNDEAWIAALHPGLTTFDVHADQLGQIAVRRLAQRMSSTVEEPPLEISFEATLVEAESVADLRS